MKKTSALLLVPTLLLAAAGCKTVGGRSQLKESAEENCFAVAAKIHFIEYAIAPLAAIPNAGGAVSALKAFMDFNSDNCNDLTFARWMEETKVVLANMNTQYMEFSDSYYKNFSATEGADLKSPIDTLEDNLQVLDKIKGQARVAASTRDALNVLRNKLDAETAIVNRSTAKIPEVITAYSLGMQLGAVAVGQSKVFDDRYGKIRFTDANEKAVIDQVMEKSLAVRVSFKALVQALINKRNDQNYGAKIVTNLNPSPFYKTHEVNDRDCEVLIDSPLMYWQGSELDVKFGGTVVYQLEALGSIASRTDLRASLEGQVLRVKFNGSKQGICTWDALNKIVQQNAGDQLANYYNSGIPDTLRAQADFNNAANVVDRDILNKGLEAANPLNKAQTAEEIALATEAEQAAKAAAAAAALKKSVQEAAAVVQAAAEANPNSPYNIKKRIVDGLEKKMEENLKKKMQGITP